jgi:hypothetical protein
MRSHTAPGGRIIQRKDSVRSTARFERANLLKVFALKKDRGSACLIQPRTRQNKSAMNMWLDPFVRSKDSREIDIHFDHPK